MQPGQDDTTEVDLFDKSQMGKVVADFNLLFKLYIRKCPENVITDGRYFQSA